MQISLLKGHETEKYYDRFYELLTMCDEDFFPPLSSRASTTQKELKGGEKSNDGVKKYCDAMVGQNILVALTEDEICGFISFKENYTNSEIPDSDKPNIYISTVLVNPAFRGRKITAGLYEHLLSLYRERNIFTRTWSGNDAHTKILMRLGFAEHRRIKNDRAPGVDTVYYVLNIRE